MNRLVRRGTLVATLLLLPTGGPGASVLPPAPPEARVAIRSGDPAPVQAAFGKSFACRLVAPQRGAAAPSTGDPFLFADAEGTALYLGADQIPPAPLLFPAPLVYVGQEVAGGGRLGPLCGAAIGTDGTIAFRAELADGREGIFRNDPQSGQPVPLIVSGGALDLRDGPATAGLLSDVAVDSAGEIVAAIDFLEGVSAIIKIPRTGAAVMLIQTGDPLGNGSFMRATTSPGISQNGTVGFTASLDDGSEVVGMIAPGAAPVVRFAPVGPVGQPAPTVSIGDPAINDAGTIAFLSADRGQVQLRQVGATGSVMMLAAPGMPAPGGGTFQEITDLDPTIDGRGEILFGANRSNGRAGIYLVGPGGAGLVPVIEEGMSFTGFGTVTAVPNREGEGTPAFRSGGRILFAAEMSLVSGLFSLHEGAGFGSLGDLAGVVAAGAQIGGTIRFASFLDNALPLQGGGPALAVGPGPMAGSLVFDAHVTGGSRGLFVRDRAGAIQSLTLPAAGSGQQLYPLFDEHSLTFHSMNGAGVVAFLGSDFSPHGPGMALFYGVPPHLPGAGSFDDLFRRVGVGDVEPGGTRTIVSLQAPSRVNAMGQVALPMTLDDGSMILLGYDGRFFFRVAAPGDPAPGGGTVTQIFTGSFFLGASVAPALDDTGRVVFGALTSLGDFALFAAPLALGGGHFAVRVAGAGDVVDGGRLSPFELQGVDTDPAGRVAFSSIYDQDADFGLFLNEGGATKTLALKFDLVDDLGFVASVPPRFAFAGDGRLGYALCFFDGSEAILLREATAAGSASAAGASAGGPTLAVDSTPTTVIAASGQPAPGGGNYRFFQAGFRQTGRLSSDGNGSLAFAATTDAGPQEIVVFGPPPPPANRSPVADAGPDQVVECAQIGGAMVQLDGTASSDPDGDSLTYEWTGPFGLAEGARPLVFLPLGVSQVHLAVKDGRLYSPPATVTINVRDTAPPAIVVTAAPNRLWPVTNKLVDVSFNVSASDVCDPNPSVTLGGVSAVESGQTLVPGPWVAGAAIGTDDRSLQLRAERGGAASDGRTYVINYRAADQSRNSALGSANVTVPHDQRH